MKKLVSLLLILTLVLSLAACGKEEAVPSVDVAALYETIADQLPEMYYPDDTTLLNFLGIDVADCAQYKVAVCAEGMRADEVWFLEARDDAALETLKELAQTRIQAKLDETESYVPDQFLIVQKAQVVTNGRYLALVISPEVDTLIAAFQAAFQ